MDTHIHQILGTAMGTRMASPYAKLFMGERKKLFIKEERIIILTFLHLIYFWKRFIGDIFFIFLVSHSQLKSLMTSINTISPTINNKPFTIITKRSILDVAVALDLPL